MKVRSWLIIIILIAIVAFAAGIRQGMHVEHINALQKAQAIKPPPETQPDEPNVNASSYSVIEDNVCGIQYVLPATAGSESGAFSIVCDVTNATDEALLTQNTFERISVATPGAIVREVWIKADPDIQTLIRESVRPIDLIPD